MTGDGIQIFRHLLLLSLHDKLCFFYLGRFRYIYVQHPQKVLYFTSASGWSSYQKSTAAGGQPILSCENNTHILLEAKERVQLGTVTTAPDNTVEPEKSDLNNRLSVAVLILMSS